MRSMWNLGKRLPENFPAYFMNYASAMPETERIRLEDTMGLQATGLFDTHPSNGDRIRRARQAGEPGVFNLEAPASALFSSFEVPARQVTVLHYQDDLGLPLELAKLVPVESKDAATVEAAPAAAEEAVLADPIQPAPAGGLRLKRTSSEQA
jgi:hypothetical protein